MFRLALMILAAIGAGPRVPPVQGQTPAQGEVRVQEEVPELIVPDVALRFEKLFQRRPFHYTGGAYQDHLFQYRLFVPVIGGDRRYPILVWLHGAGEAGSDNVKQLAWLGKHAMPPPWRRERFPFFMLCVQCPSDNGSWNGVPTLRAANQQAGSDMTGSDMISVTDAILADVLEQFPIDQNRIYLAGISSGGTGCLQYGLRHADRFAAIAPMAGSGVDGDYSLLKDVPVWVFHSAHDQSSPVAGARRNTALLRAAGGHVKLTEVSTVSHNCWTAAFDRHQLLKWMLSQRKGGPVVMDIRPWRERASEVMDNWTMTQLIGQLVVVVLLGAGLIVVLKRVAVRRKGHT